MRPFTAAQGAEDVSGSDRSLSFVSFMLRRRRQTKWISTEDQALKKPAGLPVEELCIEFGEADDLM
jgi:hypothetical protein